MNATEARACIERLVQQDRERRERDPKLLNQFKATLKIVSEEIYSHDSHFVFELIQNAEDNDYPLGCVDRYVHFVLDRRRICIANNEVGFSAANVEAICSVGDSTKVDRTRGYVGEKGIGFKSVFKVTQAPEIHSGPFHFRFDNESYVVPAWCDPPGDLGIDPTATVIVLPLRPSLRDEAENSLRSDFQDLPGETLLFLKTLNRIVIEDRTSGMTRRLQRRAGAGGVVEILDGAGAKGWWVHGRDVEVPAGLAEKKRRGVKVREIILAFRTGPGGQCLRFNDAVVYAFLPTGIKPGLPFLVQSDFLTTASRESIHGDSAWNRWLRDELAPTYLEAIRRGVAGSEAFRLTFLQTLPIPDEVGHAFFKPLAKSVLASIAGERVFPGQSGQLRPLAEVFRADETMRRLFPPKYLSGLLGADAEYLDPRFQIPEAVSGWLEIPDIRSRIGTLLGDQDWLAGRDDDWFIDLYGYLNENPNLIDEDDLRALPIVRLEGGRLVAVGDDLVYLPPSEERVEESYGLKQFTFRVVAHAIVRRHPSPRNEAEKRLNRRTKAARDFLIERLDVKLHRPLEITWNQVLPHLEGQGYDSIEALRIDFGLVLYIKEHWAQIQKDADADGMNLAGVFGGLPLPTLGSRKKQTVRSVRESYLPAELGGNPAFARLMQGVPDVWFVDADLLVTWDVTRKRKERKLKEWQAFLADLGAPRGMRLVHRTWCLPHEEDSPPAGELVPGESVTRIAHHATIADLQKLFAYLADKATSTRDERGKLLLKLLDRHWAGWEGRHPVAAQPARSWWESVYSFQVAGRRRGREETKVFPAEFIRLLRSEAWAPVRGDGGPQRPGEVWARDDDGLGLASGRCLAVPVENADLVRALGIRTRLSVEELLAELEARVEREDVDLAGYRQLLGMLAVAWREEGYGLSLTSHLSANRLIFLPGRPNFPFAAADEVVWKNPHGRSSRGIPSLESAYPALKDFFTRLGVHESPTPQLALQTLKQVKEIYDPDDADRVALERLRAWEAYQALAEADFAKDGGNDELQEFRSEGMLLGEDGDFHACEALVAPDDRDLAALFREAGAAMFLLLPEGHHDAPDVARAVAKLLDIPRVSEAARTVDYVESLPDPGCAEVAATFDGIRRDLLGFIRKESRSCYDALVASGQAAALAHAPLRFADRIAVGYTLLDRSITDPREPALAIDSAGLVLRTSRAGELFDIAADLQSTLDVKGLANAFVTLMMLLGEKRSAYVNRLGYVVPDEEWAAFGCPSLGLAPLEEAGRTPLPSTVGAIEGLDSPRQERFDGDGLASETGPRKRTSREATRGGSHSDPSTNGASHAEDEKLTDGRSGVIPGTSIDRHFIDPDPGGDAASVPAENDTGSKGRTARRRNGRPTSDWEPPAPGRQYAGPTKFRSPRASNDRLIERLGGAPAKREVREYLEGPREIDPPNGDPDAPPPASIRTTLFAVNLHHGFLRFSPPDFRIFGPGSPESIQLIDDDGEQIAIDVDYRAGILHGPGFADWLAIHVEWPYGTILRLDPINVANHYHLRAGILDEPVDIGDVEFFEFDDDGVPRIVTCHPDPFTVEFDENVYRQERRWENRRALDALVAARGEGVLASVYQVMETSDSPLSASEVHRALLRAGRPCSFFSVRAVLHGYACFNRSDDRWELWIDQESIVRPGYDSLLGPQEDGSEVTARLGEEASPSGCADRTLLAPSEVSRLIGKLEALSKPDPGRWGECLAVLLSSLRAVQARLEEQDRRSTRGDDGGRETRTRSNTPPAVPPILSVPVSRSDA